MKKLLTWAYVTCSALLMFPVTVLADGPAPITNLKNWAIPQLKDAFVIVLGALAIFCFVKRAYAAMIGILAGAVVVALMIYSPETIATWGEKLGKVIFQ